MSRSDDVTSGLALALMLVFSPPRCTLSPSSRLGTTLPMWSDRMEGTLGFHMTVDQSHLAAMDHLPTSGLLTEGEVNTQ